MSKTCALIPPLLSNDFLKPFLPVFSAASANNFLAAEVSNALTAYYGAKRADKLPIDKAQLEYEKAAFLEDLKVSKELTEERYNQRSNWIKFKQSIAKLASPIL